MLLGAGQVIVYPFWHISGPIYGNYKGVDFPGPGSLAARC